MRPLFVLMKILKVFIIQNSMPFSVAHGSPGEKPCQSFTKIYKILYSAKNRRQFALRKRPFPILSG